MPLFVKGDFGKFYQARSPSSVEKEDMRAVFTEYVWDMGWCDPCAAQPLSAEELRQLGVFWLSRAQPIRRSRRGFPPGGTVNVLLTRLHVRYDGAHFPEDLVFQETSDRTNFQGRYILQHPYKGAGECSAPPATASELRERAEQGGRDAGLAHRLAHGGHPPQDGTRLRRPAPGRSALVEEDVERVATTRGGRLGCQPTRSRRRRP